MTNQSRSKLAYFSGLIVSAIIAMVVLDVPIARWVHESSFSQGYKVLFRVMRLPGDFRFTLFLAAFLLWRAGSEWKRLIGLLTAGALASGITAVLKLCFGRIRPFHGSGAFEWQPMKYFSWAGFQTPNLSFPSGDATLAFATATAFSLIFPRWRAVAFIWAAIVAAARVLQGAHYPSDVLAGALVGSATADALFRLDYFRPRQATRLAETFEPDARHKTIGEIASKENQDGVDAN